MTYVCLAAGKGTRFARLSTYLQKCMYPVGVHPFVEYSVANLLASSSIDKDDDELCFVIGHQGQQLRDYFGDSYHGLRVRYVEQPEQLGTGHAIDTARRSIGFEGPAVAWLADLFVPAEYFDSVRTNRAESALTIGTSDHETNDNVRVDIDGEVIVRAWQGSSEYFDIGLWKLGPEILDTIASTKSDEYRVLVNVQRAIESGAEVGYHIADEWIHLGGVDPTIEENVRSVVSRMAREESIFGGGSE